jgi:hypothetical protein
LNNTLMLPGRLWTREHKLLLLIWQDQLFNGGEVLVSQQTMCNGIDSADTWLIGSLLLPFVTMSETSTP